MHIVLDALRMMDDGIIKTVGTNGGDENSGWKDKKGGPPIIKGPIVDYMHIIDEQRFAEGQRVITEGNFGKWIWVVLQGMVEITQQTPWGRSSWRGWARVHSSDLSRHFNSKKVSGALPSPLWEIPIWVY